MAKQIHREKLAFDDPEALQALCGSNNSRLKLIERTAGAEVHLRGNEITIEGEEGATETAKSALEQLYDLALAGKPLSSDDVVRAVRLLQGNGDNGQTIATVFGETILTPRAGRPIAPKGATQKKYVDLVRSNDIVFAVGPAGTGKTYLAMALAVRALLDKQVRRIILTRPAVEAGERLGFLPGTLEEKVDPYLRPLFDALHDMMDPERLTRNMADDIIEVAPLAFLRGRAQPLSSNVLTPTGWRRIGDLEVGDEVIGSDGWPTRVDGVYPQGTKDVFRVTMTDGASTHCCAEHLWSVYTLEDRRRNKPPRVVDTATMAATLHRHKQCRYELPLLRAPVAFPPQRVPLEPYALGLLLGDGCITGSTTPTFATRDRELVDSLQIGLGERIELVHKAGPDFVLRHRGEHRGGRREANPVTEQLRELGLCGTRSNTKFVPAMYLFNCAEVRLAVLQGLLDTDGGPVTQQGSTCRIQYTTTSPRLRDDVLFLVRSLGGIAYCRTRLAAGRSPGLANGRPVVHRHDAYILDIRLPNYVKPFRLVRKAKLYHEHGSAPPKRFVRRIEPAGREETRCIRVAAPDSLYVTDDLILTHNTLNESFIVLDEAQNTTPAQMKMFLTRMGYGAKVVITGDITQTDLPAGQRSGLRDALDLVHDIRGIGTISFTDADVVRHPLVAALIRAYDARDRARFEAREARENREPQDKGSPDDIDS
ncbi:MAG TPA: PhoH family protein [Kofleriaceae bacterium]|nr:PhoH family protein [Kofleriaceae bacterium]